MSSEPPKAAAPAAPLAPGNFDRAWNDPPLFSYHESSTQQSQNTGLKLNKRVMFPTDQTSPPTKAVGESGDGPPKLHDAGARPPPDSILPPPPAALVQDLQASVAAKSSKEEEMVVIDLDEICSALRDLANRFCGTRSADIVKRLGLMEQCWQSDSFNPRIGVILSEIKQALESENFVEAERKLTTLSADHAGECAQWIIALRHIFTAMKDQCAKPQAQTVDPHVVPFFTPVMHPDPVLEPDPLP